MLNIAAGCTVTGNGFKLQTAEYSKMGYFPVRVSFTNISIPEKKMKALNRTWAALKLPTLNTYDEDIMAYFGQSEHIHVGRELNDWHILATIIGVGVAGIAISYFIHKLGGCSRQCHGRTTEFHTPTVIQEVVVREQPGLNSENEGGNSDNEQASAPDMGARRGPRPVHLQPQSQIASYTLRPGRTGRRGPRP